MAAGNTMASSVASAKEMERWRRERELAKATKVDMPESARKNFQSMKADFEQVCFPSEGVAMS